jgi:uncharacterized protein YkwD
VANYYPAGNYANQFSQNVPMPEHRLKPAGRLIASTRNMSQENGNSLPNPNLMVNLRVNSGSKINEYDNILPRKDDVDKGSDWKRNNSSVSFDEMQNRFIQEALEAHNKYRRRHNVPMLIHNPELSKIAQDYAKQIARQGSLIHSKNKYKSQNLGENLAFSYDSRVDYYDGM